jgi:ABC-type multidrug transport system permease subunit
MQKSTETSTRYLATLLSQRAHNTAESRLGLLRAFPASLLPAPVRAAARPSRAGALGFPTGDGLAVFTPGAIVMIGMFGTTFVRFGLIAQLRAGVVERLKVTPTSRLALLLGSALREVAQLLVQAIMLIAVAWLLRLNLNLAGIGVMLVLLALMGLLMASCSYALALKEENAFASTLQFFLLPLLLLSGVFLPLTLAPGWIQSVAAFNPRSPTTRWRPRGPSSRVSW